jgi:hypothetical protein
MRRLLTVLLLGMFLTAVVGCSEPTPPPEQDSAANASPETLNTPEPPK